MKLTAPKVAPPALCDDVVDQVLVHLWKSRWLQGLRIARQLVEHAPPQGMIKARTAVRSILSIHLVAATGCASPDHFMRRASVGEYWQVELSRVY